MSNFKRKIFFQILWPSQNIWTLIIQQEGHMPLSNYAKLQTLLHHLIRLVWFQVEIGKIFFYFLKLKSYEALFDEKKVAFPRLWFWLLIRIVRLRGPQSWKNLPLSFELTYLVKYLHIIHRSKLKFLIFKCFESHSIISISLLRVYIKMISSQL